MTFSRSTLPSDVFGRPDGAPVFLWATPRSVSTAFERVMKNSPELHVVHEPFTDAYYFGPDRRSSRYGDRASAQFVANPIEIESSIRNCRPGVRAFVKELAFQGEPYVSDAMLAEARQLIITRHPAAVYASLIKLKPDFTEEEFGFTALSRLYRRLRTTGLDPVVIDGDVFRAEPEATTRRACEAISVTFDPDMLRWSDGRIRSWSSGEKKSQAIWHETLERSRTVLKPDPSPPEIEVHARHRAWYERALMVYGTLTNCASGRSEEPYEKNPLPLS